jgi:hypothetical protein
MIVAYADFVARRERRQRIMEELACRPGNDAVNEPDDGRTCAITLDAAPACPPVPLRASGARPLSFPKPR